MIASDLAPAHVGHRARVTLPSGATVEDRIRSLCADHVLTARHGAGTCAATLTGGDPDITVSFEGLIHEERHGFAPVTRHTPFTLDPDAPVEILD